jgi:hypothetical protein
VVVVLTFFSLVLGELLPKRIGLNHPEAIAKAVAVPMKMISIVTAPFIWLLTVSTDGILKLLNIKPTAAGMLAGCGSKTDTDTFRFASELDIQGMDSTVVDDGMSYNAIHAITDGCNYYCTYCTIPFAFNLSKMSLATTEISANCSSPLKIGTITT